jgi:predicted GIY-YIG superfamily endonuclease
MSHYVYLMASEDRKSIHAGWTVDLEKAIEQYNRIPSISWPQKKSNMLVYFIEYGNPEDAKLAFEEVTKWTLEKKTEAVLSLNPEFIELVPGVHFEVKKVIKKDEKIFVNPYKVQQ